MGAQLKFISLFLSHIQNHHHYDYLKIRRKKHLHLICLKIPKLLLDLNLNFHKKQI
jgi:hypothetical protein